MAEYGTHFGYHIDSGKLGSTAHVFHRKSTDAPWEKHNTHFTGKTGFEGEKSLRQIVKKYGKIYQGTKSTFEPKESTTEGYDQTQEKSSTITKMLNLILAGELSESKESFASILSAKIAVELEEAKIKVAQNFFESKADDLWKSAEDEHEKTNSLNKGIEKSDEVGEDEEKNNAVRQIKAIHDEHHNPLKTWDPTKHRDENEAENPNDKRVQGGAAARAAKGETTKANELISYNHADGSKSVVNKDDSNVLFHTLSGAAGAKATIKKDTREKLLSLVHKNPEGLKTGTDLIKKLLSSGDKKHFENSIYESFDLSESSTN